jgi:DNA repair exonuclease SbcCD nuclease subunit
MKLLLSGDLHIGRSSTRLPASVRREDVRAATAWNRIVDLALAERVAAVCLSGDIVDRDNRFWEAIGALEKGVNRLAKSDIRTIAVAGNHDYDVLARLALNLPPEHFKFLGRDGIWERITLTKEGGGSLHLDGWSFPTQRVHASPLDSYNLPNDSAVPILGIVHGDLDVANTPYGKLELSRLQSLPPAGWLLGHIHATRLVHADGLPWVLYPGSPQALDPGETGLHGPWLVNFESGSLGLPELRPLSSVYYGSCDVDLNAAADDAEVESAVIDRIREEAERIVSHSGSTPAVVSLRLRLVGSTPAAPRVRETIARIVEDLTYTITDATVCIDTVDVQTVPPIDLAEYAKTQSAPGVIARLLLELDGVAQLADVAELLRQAKIKLDDLERYKDFAGLERREIDEQLVREYLRTGARALLTQLVAQNG